MFRFAVAGLSALVLVAAAPVGQQPSAVRESAEVVLVEVPVRVLDRQGSPVANLTEKDFELYDDGKRQEIVAFDRIDLAQKGAAPDTPEAVNPAARRHFLLLFDFSFAKPKAVLAARRAAKEFVLSGMGDRDFAAVATFLVERGIRLLVTFSSDRIQLARAIETLGLTDPNSLASDPLSFVYDVIKAQGGGDLLASDRSGRIAEAQAAGILESLQTLASLERARLDQFERARIARLTDSLGGLATALDAVQGRKDVIYLSEGFESRLLVGAKENNQEHDWKLSGEEWKVDPEKTYGNANLQEQLKAMAGLFRRSDCVIHAVDIGGLKNDSDPDYRSLEVVRGENALFEIANATGGELLRNDNDFKTQLARLIARTNLVYVLAFRPAKTGREDRYHDLKVKVHVPGARVSARAGYYERKGFKQLSPLERNLVTADIIANEIPVSDIPLRVLASAHPGEGELAFVPVLIEVPTERFLLGQKGNRASAEIYAYVHDTENRVRDFFAQTVNLDLAVVRERLERGSLRYYGQVVLPPGDYRLRVLVRNAETGRLGLTTELLHVPDFAGKRPYIAQPVFLEGAEEGILVRGRSGTHTGSTRPGALLEPAGGELLPVALPELHAGSPARLSVVAYNFGDPSMETLKIGAHVLSAEGRPIGQGQIEILSRSAPDSNGKQVLVVVFHPDGLNPGDYALRVFLRDAASGRSGHASTPFVVR
jgi:VWFA-related protein